MRKFLYGVGVFAMVVAGCLAVQAKMTYPTNPTLGAAAGAVNADGITNNMVGLQWAGSNAVDVVINTITATALNPLSTMGSAYKGPVLYVMQCPEAIRYAYVPATYTSWVDGFYVSASSTTSTEYLWHGEKVLIKSMGAAANVTVTVELLHQNW